MSEQTVLVLHAEEDAKYLPALQQCMNIIANTTYHRRVRFVVKSATAGRELTDEIIEAVLTIAFISPGFAQSLWMEAFPQAHALAKRYGKAVIPVYVRPWSISDRDFVVRMVPHDRAISQYKDKDTAWNVVSQSLRSLLQRGHPEGF